MNGKGMKRGRARLRMFLLCSHLLAIVPRMHWGAHIGIPESSIEQEHLRILRKAVLDAGEFDPRTGEVYAALDYLQAKSLHRWGFTVFKEGLEKNTPGALRHGLRLIHQHLGISRAG